MPFWPLVPGSRMNITDHISECLETIFWVKILKFFDADPDPGIFLTLDPGWKKFGNGIRDKHSDSKHWVIIVSRQDR